MPWSVLTSIQSSRRVERSSIERVRAANASLRVAANARDRILCDLLIQVEGAEGTSVFLSFLPLPCVTGFMCGGIAAVGERLYCAPKCAESVLVIDAVTQSISPLPLPKGFDGNFKCDGIAAVGERLYCAPHDAAGVLVIDAGERSVRCLPLPEGFDGNGKCVGIAAVGKRLYCAPCNAKGVLVIDTATDSISSLPLPEGFSGDRMWTGIAAVGER